MKHERPNDADVLTAGLREAGGTPDRDTLARLAQWLATAGRSAGLTHYATPELMAARGMIPAVGVVEVAVRRRAASLAEIGPGCGALGLTIAAALPALPVSLLDRRPKCVAFLETAAARLRLSNVRAQVANLPVDDPYQVAGPFDVVAVRAFAAGPVAIAAAASVAVVNGRVLWLHRAGHVCEAALSDGVLYVSTTHSGVAGLDMSQFTVSRKG